MTENLKKTDIFTTPIWECFFDNFDIQKNNFLKAIELYKKSNRSVHFSNYHGYQSKNIKHLKEFENIFKFIENKTLLIMKDYDFVECDCSIESAWFNINDSRSSFNLPHIHGNVFSGVFYLKVPKESGEIFFPNRSINPLWRGFNYLNKYSRKIGILHNVNPEEGKIIIFPSYVEHFVSTNNHNDERISISFNIKLTDKNFSYDS